MKTGLFFGSFNPLHNGHLQIAQNRLNIILINMVCRQSSQSIKNESGLIPAEDRLIMAKQALEKYPDFEVCDIEFNMPKPSYTINTLEALHSQYPELNFVLIIGSDSLDQFHLWKDFNRILQNYHIIVYPRKPDYTIPKSYQLFNIAVIKSALLPISSTQIREMIRNKQDFSALVPSEVHKYLSIRSI
jgi:nicotinate-nucleotide adenylyltransferase